MTKRSQRIGIWIIAVVMAVGSLGIYFVAVLANGNQSRDAQTQQQAVADYQRRVQEQADELSEKYYPTLSGFTGEVDAFDAAGVTGLTSRDLKQGDGETIGETTTYGAYYIGWNPSGTIFDQSIADNKLKTPLTVEGNTGLIEGWTKGVVGMKLGGVRELTIPAAQAYGDQAQGDDIPANTPLKFIVLAIPAPEQIPVPSGLLQQ